MNFAGDGRLEVEVDLILDFSHFNIFFPSEQYVIGLFRKPNIRVNGQRLVDNTEYFETGAPPT